MRRFLRSVMLPALSIIPRLLSSSNRHRFISALVPAVTATATVGMDIGTITIMDMVGIMVEVDIMGVDTTVGIDKRLIETRQSIHGAETKVSALFFARRAGIRADLSQAHLPEKSP